MESTVASIRTAQVKLQYVQARYDANEVYAQPAFTGNLSEPQRTTLRQFYDACNPRPMTDLVQGNAPALDISTMRCQCTAEDLLAGLVETLATIRNALLPVKNEREPCREGMGKSV